MRRADIHRSDYVPLSGLQYTHSWQEGLRSSRALEIHSYPTVSRMRSSGSTRKAQTTPGFRPFCVLCPDGLKGGSGAKASTFRQFRVRDRASCLGVNIDTLCYVVPRGLTRACC